MKSLLRLLSCIIIVSCFVQSQNWWSYNPENVTNDPSIKINFDVPLSNTECKTHKIRLEFTGELNAGGTYDGDCLGEFWSWVSFDVEFSGSKNINEPLLYSSFFEFTEDIFNPLIAIPCTSVQPLYGPSEPAISIFGPFLPPANSLVYPTLPQAGGSAFQIDVEDSFAYVTIGELCVPFALIGIVTPVTWHVVGNISHQVDGSGWFYISLSKENFVL